LLLFRCIIYIDECTGEVIQDFFIPVTWGIDSVDGICYINEVLMRLVVLWIYYTFSMAFFIAVFVGWLCRCAPECISYLRFTSASDIWAYGVTLWEMFSYGFQPWAALTGHQILEAIDEPNFQVISKLLFLYYWNSLGLQIVFQEWLIEV